ncbi:MAG: hypothetical protein FJ045_06255, partial [Crenarchaeota archaeon]|nr:hypothetical protein [Thermoproteota archaeon]
MGEAARIERLRNAVALMQQCRRVATVVPQNRQYATRMAQMAQVISQLKALTATRRREQEGRNVSLREVTRTILDVAIKSFSKPDHNGKSDRDRFEILHRAFAGDGVPLAALSVCGHETTETEYTQLFRYMLDPKSPHGLGSRVLRVMLQNKKTDGNLFQDQMDFESARVFAEVPLGEVDGKGNRLDLLVESKGRYVFIEHKINSPEAGKAANGEGRQTVSYSRAITDNWPLIRDYCRFDKNCLAPTNKNSLKLFFTLKGTEAADPEWQELTHEEVFSGLLGLLDDARISSRAKHNLCCFLWDLMLGPILQDAAIVDELRQK